MRRRSASAKINLALIVGPRRGDGKHEVATVLQRVDLSDRIELEDSDELRVDGFPDDTLVGDSLQAFARAAGVAPRWRVRIEKRIPVAAGLGGGSSDAAAALALANETVAEPLDLHPLAAALGADVPFFLTSGPQLGRGDGSELEPLALPQDYWVLLVLPRGEHKESTAAAYERFDARDGMDGFEERRRELIERLGEVRRPADLGLLPPNDLVSSPFAALLREQGAFRADVSGAGPALYGLFAHEEDAQRAAAELKPVGRVWLTAPAWYV